MQHLDEADTEELAWMLVKDYAARLRRMGLAGKFTVGVKPNAPTQHLGRGITGSRSWRVVLYDENDDELFN